MRSRHLALGALSLLTAACGAVPSLPMPTGAAGGFAALADLPNVAKQIEDAFIRQTAYGRLVSRLPEMPKAKPVTFLTYKALDNDLGQTLQRHLNILERAGSSSAVNVLAFTDDAGPDNTFKYYLTQDRDESTITSPYTKALGGEMDTGTKLTLAHAVRWGFKSYPSKFRWLDVNDHGGGYRGIAQDDGKGSRLSLPQFASALALAGQPIDVLSFDACLMATVEVAYEVRKVAKIMVASEDSTYALGMNYDKAIADLWGVSPPEPRELADELVLRAQLTGPNKAVLSISEIDLSKAERMTQQVDALAGALLAALPKHKAAILQSLKAVPAFYIGGPFRQDYDHRDLREAATRLKAGVPDAAVAKACDGILSAAFALVLFSRQAQEQNKAARGISIYLPTDGQVDPVYKDTAFAKATRWDELLTALGR